jgi:F-type H+-transporting ATPase subunit b
MNLALLAMWSQIAGAIVFLAVAIFIWNKYIAPAVQAYRDAKNAEFAEAEGRRERLRAEVASARAEVERADAEAKELRARVEVEAKREREQILAEAQAEAARVVRNAEGELERARWAARDRLRIELIEKALQRARVEAVARLDAATNERLVSRTVSDLAENKI